ncbi:hypothetical protein [Flavobacterium sp.]|jgi:hypothetical protein|uniref:hypothetical protein n=1 Tax=Flavobacterium sp. TaxID=239 RepID=UPI0037BEC81C
MATFNEDIVGGRGMGGGVFSGGDSGGVIMGLLLGRLGLFGNQDNNGNGRCVTQDDLNAQTLGDIKASIPFNEAQVQLALAGAVSGLTTQANNNTQYITAQTQALALAQANLAASLSRDIAGVDTNVDRQSAQIQETIFRDGEATRALITSNRIADLEQQLTVAQLRESEQRGINREIVNTNTITVSMNQQQSQQQQQMQALQWQLNQLCGAFGQVARATNSTVQVGNTGTVAGAQAANPTNVVA